MGTFEEWVLRHRDQLQGASAPYAAVLVQPLRHREEPAQTPQRLSNRGTAVMSMNDVMTQARNANLLSLVQRVQPGSLFYELAAPGEVSQRRIIVGRDEKCDVRVDAQAVSSRHAMIRCGPKQSTVCDLLSSNGTSVNSAPVGSDPVTIQSADRLRFGLEEFFFLEARGLCDFLFFWLKRFLDSQA